MTPTRCAIYIRVSTAMQRMEGWSLDAQRDSLTQLAEAKGWKVIGIYADEGKSARKRLKNRTEIFRLLDDVRAGLVDVILFKELDRWFRNVSDFYKVQDVLDQFDVSWFSERQPTLDMSTKEGRLAVNILLSVGQNEADATSERIKYTNKFLRSQHRWTAGRHTLPLGFALDADQHVIIDPETEELVRDILRRVLETRSVRGTMLDINRDYGIDMHYDRYKTLVGSPLLCGRYRDDPDFMAESYLTPEEFARLQQIVRHPNRQNSEHDFIFSGLVRCGDCGRIMGGNNSGKRKYPYYKCPHITLTKDLPFTMISEARLERELLPFVREALEGRIAEVTAVREKNKRRRPKSNRAQIEKRLERLEDLYINDETMTRERYEQKRAEILAKLVEPQPDNTEQELSSLEALRQIFSQSFDEIYQGMTDKEKQTFWCGILESVTVRNKQIIDIKFRA